MIPDFSMEIQAFFVVFARIGTFIIMMPALGETRYPARVRVALAIMISLLATPLSGGQTIVAHPALLVPVLGLEVAVGLFFALAMRVILSAVQIFGGKFGFYAGLSNSFAPNDGVTEGGSSVAAMIHMGLIAVILATNTHHVMIIGAVRSYGLIPVGSAGFFDISEQLARLGANAFWMATMIGAPFMIYSVLANMALGIANKVMPSLQVFFVAGPALILIGFLVLAFVFPSLIEAVRADLAGWALNPVR
ncbi:flagellar biosynthetic protein FliR [Paracoccus sp. ME4]|uniref:flagellar biosynthetic protein FliR n=1 Tax=Paracoccus sp. ME4 TaxID=3138066 RepID=UPI00398A6F39